MAAGGAALLLVLAGFLGVARLKGHGFHLDVPGRLGVDISQTANGFTYSQSQKGHTLFTIHASKLVQYKGDQAELHDVTITLYGPDGSGRSDKIYGADFTYNRKQGIARAAGPVRIEFAAPGTKPGQTADAGTIHVTTSGVVFTQSTEEATTEQRVDFSLPKASGSATGADYNAKDGVLVLDREVALTASGNDGAATVIRAGHAQLLTGTHQAYLIKADADFGGKHSTSDQATVTFRPDGSAEQVEARGHVRVLTDDGAEVHAGNALIGLDPKSQPTVTELAGGVTYDSTANGETMQGSAVAGTLHFADGALPGARTGAQLKHAQFRDAVTFVLQRHSLPGDANGSATREMRASKLDIDFAPGAHGRAEARFALGSGGALVNLHDVPSKGPARSSSIGADQLLATLANGREFRALDGKGRTRLVDTASDGATSTSTGDTLHVTLLANSAGGRGSGTSAQVDTALQKGNVTLLQQPGPDAKNSDGSPQSPLHATAEQAEYHAADQLLHLTGSPRLHHEAQELSADRVDYHRETGDASATGNVKSTYEQQGSSRPAPGLGGEGPVHVTADHATLTRKSNLTVFYGAQGGQARMWQGGNAVSAPVLELSRDQQTLDAHGERGERTAVVHAMLESRSNGAGRGPAGDAAAAQQTLGEAAARPAPGKPEPRQTAPARLSSVTLHYADKEHRADLRGLVTAEQPSGVLHADQAQIYLTPAGPNKAAQLDRIVASNHVVITQPGRRGTGDKLVYSAADGRYMLTGSPGDPPRIVDAEKGTTTGAALLFKTADDSVEVSSGGGALPVGAPAGATARTVTDTHAPR